MKKKILIIDDDYGVIKTWTSQLQKMNYQVTCFSNANAVLGMINKATENFYDCIILDYYLNDSLNGIELLDEFKKSKLFSDVPVIMMSSNEDIKLVQESFSHGITMYILKDLRNPPSYLDSKIQSAMSIGKLNNHIKNILEA